MIVCVVVSSLAGATFTANDRINGTNARTTQTIAQIYDVEIVNGQDQDGDGYYSDFDLRIQADTKCDACYDPEDPTIGDSAGEFYFAIWLDSVHITSTEEVPNRENFDQIIYIDQEDIEDKSNRLDRGSLTLKVELKEKDLDINNIIDDLTETVRWEPGYVDNGGTPQTPTEPPPTSSDDGEHELTLEADGKGSVTAGIGLLMVSADEQDSEMLLDGQEVEIEAEPEEGFKFDHWSGDVPSGKQNDSVITVQMDEDKNVTAHFVLDSESGEGFLEANTTRLDESSVRVDYTIRNQNETALSGVQLQLQNLTDSWTITNQSVTEGQWAADTHTWFWQSIPANDTVQASATLASNESNDTRSGGKLTAVLSAPAGIDETVTVDLQKNQSASSDGFRLAGEASTTTVEPGESTRLEYNLTNTNASERTGVALSLDTPSNWDISPRTTNEGLWASDTKTLFWQSIDANTTKTATLVLSVPGDTEPGTYTINATVSDSQNNTATANVTVTVTE